MQRLPRRQVAGTGALVAVAVAAAIWFSPDRVVEELVALESRPVAFGLVLCVLYLFRPLFAWPISPISALVGFVLGVELGVPVALAGAVATSVPPYLLARWAASEQGFFGVLGRSGRRIVEVTGATRGVVAARLSPVPADPVSYGAGFAGVSLRPYLVGTLVGEIPWVLVEVTAGASMRALSVSGMITGLHVLVISVAVSILIVARPAYRHVAADGTD